MNGSCEFYADALIDLARGELEAGRAERVEAHLATCDECRGALDVIRAVQAAPAVAPAGLESRLQSALREVYGAGAASRTERSGTTLRGSKRVAGRGWRPWAIPLAAAAALVVWLGASELISPPVGTERLPEPSEVAEAEYDPYGAWPGSDGVVAGELVLSELSVEELEALLEEMR